MESIKALPSKITANDPFNLSLTIRGLVFQLIPMSSNVYEYAYYFTFKRSRKSYAHEFNDAWKMPIDKQRFFLDTGDLVVINCCSVENKILDLKIELMRRFAINEKENYQDEVAHAQAKRFEPYRMMYKNSKSYKKLKMYYERTILEYIEYLYKIACVLTASSYRIPLILKKQFLLEDNLSLRLLNSDDDTVVLLMNVMTSLRIDLANLRSLDAKKKK